MPEKKWLVQYEAVKEKLRCKIDLESYFTEPMIHNVTVDVLEIGHVHIPTGRIFACDPLIGLEDALPFLQTVPIGTYPVKICVVPSEEYGDRYACVKMEISQNKPVLYELGVEGNEDLNEELEEDEFFGFCVDAGMGCIADCKTQEAFGQYWKQRTQVEDGIDPYNDLWCDWLAKNAQAYPKYQREYGDWLNWTVPGTDCNMPIFASGWGDGVYPCYFGYDAEGQICGVYILLIDIEDEFGEKKVFDGHDQLLKEMYQDGYFPDFLVDRVKTEMEKVIALLECGETDVEVIQKKLDEMTCAINDLQYEFEEHDSEIETVARDCIGETVVYILDWFDIPIDVEDAIRERDW